MLSCTVPLFDIYLNEVGLVSFVLFFLNLLSCCLFVFNCILFCFVFQSSSR